MIRLFQQKRFSVALSVCTLTLLCFHSSFFVSVGVADHPQDLASQVTDEVHLQGNDWMLLRGAELQRVEHDGQDALWFRPQGSRSIALLADERFEEGTLEMDLAVDYRHCPTIALFSDKRGENYVRLAIKPWPVFEPEKEHPRLRQAVVVSEQQGSINLHFNAHGPVPESLYRWFHIRLVVQGDRCEVFIDDDKSPALSVGLPHRSGKGAFIGLIQRSCYLKNIRIHSLDS